MSCRSSTSSGSRDPDGHSQGDEEKCGSMALKHLYVASIVIALVVAAFVCLVSSELRKYSPHRGSAAWSPASVETALVGLNSPHLDIRRKSLAFLREKHDPAGLEKARQILLVDPVPGISGDAAAYLSEMQDDSFAHLVLAGKQYTAPQKLNVISALTGSTSTRSVKALRVLAKDPSSEVRIAAASVLHYRERGLEPPFRW